MFKPVVCALGLCVAAFGAASSQAATVLINGTFDNNTTGWTGSYSSQESLTTGFFPVIDTGNYFFAGNVPFTASITQTYALSSAEITAANTGALTFDMSADLWGFSDQPDFSVFKADFRAANGAVLASESLSSEDGDPGTWSLNITAGETPNFQSVSGSVLAGTESILFTVSSTRGEGQSSDGYVDNAFLELTITPVPIPASGLFLGASCALFVWRGRRKRC